MDSGEASPTGPDRRPEAPPGEKPYHAKRPHRKSRRGCMRCKHRRVKCDEARPACRACAVRKEACVYPCSPAASRSASPFTLEAGPLAVSPRSSGRLLSGGGGTSRGMAVLSEPLFCPAGIADELDMRLLWFYTTRTYLYLSVKAQSEHSVNHLLTIKVVEHAFRSPFLMDCLLGFSALHLQSMKQDIPPRRAIGYRVRAFGGYRKAIERARHDEFPALVACSLLLCGLSSQMFRDPATKDIYLVDWMIVWHGIKRIWDLISPEAWNASGLDRLFERPKIDVEKAAMCTPNNLLFMMTSIREGDPDFPYISAYYDAVRYLGHLYLELENGFSSAFDLGVVTYLTFMPPAFVEVARQRRPRALVILAYYAAFTKLVEHVWWMAGIADHEIPGISRILDPKWHSLLKVPRSALEARGKVELRQLLLANHA